MGRVILYPSARTAHSRIQTPTSERTRKQSPRDLASRRPVSSAAAIPIHPRVHQENTSHLTFERNARKRHGAGLQQRARTRTLNPCDMRTPTKPSASRQQGERSARRQQLTSRLQTKRDVDSNSRARIARRVDPSLQLDIVPHETADNRSQHPPEGASNPTPARRAGRLIHQLARRRSAEERAIYRYLSSDHKLGSKSMAEDGEQESVPSLPEGRQCTASRPTCLDPKIVSANHLGTKVFSHQTTHIKGKHQQNHSPA